MKKLGEASELGRTKIKGRISIRELFNIPDYSPTDLKKIRKKINLSQSQMALLTGYKLRSIQNWEAENRTKDISDGVRRIYQLIENPKALESLVNIFKDKKTKKQRAFG